MSSKNLMTEAPKTIWEHEEHHLSLVAISSSGDVVAAASLDSLYVWDGSGNLLWKKQVPEACLCVSVSRDGLFIAVGTSSGDFRLYSLQREEHHYFSQEHSIIGIAFVGGGSKVLVASYHQSVALLPTIFDNTVYWHYPLNSVVSVATSRDGRITAVGTEDDEIYILDANGKLLRTLAAEGTIYSVALDGSGTYLAASSLSESKIFLYRTDGDLLWSKTHESIPLRVAITEGGEIIASALESGLILYQRDGSELLYQPSDKTLYSVELSSDASSIVIGSSGGIQYLKSNLPPLSSIEDRMATLQLILNLRHDYLNCQPEGLCRWLDEFDSSLRSEKFDLCEELLEEMNGGGYQLKADEREYVTSRQGALSLRRGISHHRRNEIQEASKFYKQAVEEHRSARNFEGEGQARALLGMLEQGTRSQDEITDALERFSLQLKVLGSGEALLTSRVKTALPAEGVQVVYAAKEIGYLEPLLAALSGTNEIPEMVAATAAASLLYLRPGAEVSTLLTILTHPNWFVRWRIAGLLNRLGDTDPLPPAVLENIASTLVSERDPMVLLELIELTVKCGGRALTPALVLRLADPDADVKFAVCKALRDVGDRRALSRLREVQEEHTISIEGILMAASDAINEITSRHPAPTIESIILNNPSVVGGGDSNSYHLFASSVAAINGAVRLRNLHSPIGALVRQDPSIERRFILDVRTESMPGANPRSREFLSSHTSEGAAFEETNPLVELVPKIDDEWAWGNISFSLECPSGGWKPGEYTLDLYSDDELLFKNVFEIVETVNIEDCVISSSLGTTNVDSAIVFLTTTEKIFCSVTLDKAPMGIEVRGLLCDRQLELIAAEGVKTTVEGRQQVQLCWTNNTWKPGKYLAIVYTEIRSWTTHEITFVDAVRVVSAKMLRVASESGQTTESVSSYLAHEDFVLSVHLTEAPTDYKVSAEWFYKGQRIGNGLSIAITRQSGEQTAIFTFHRPQAGWPKGRYSANVLMKNTQPYRITFSVRSYPISYELRRLGRETGAFIRKQTENSITRAFFRSAGTALGIGLLFYLVAVTLRKLIGVEVVDSTIALRLGDSLSDLHLGWWPLGGAVFGILSKVKLSEQAARVFKVFRTTMTLILSAVLWQQMTYLVFSLGYLSPNALAGLFSKTTYASPFLAWIGAFFILWLDLYRNMYKPIRDLSISLILLLIIYLFGMIGSVSFGIAAWLGTIMLSNQLTQTAWDVGVCIGFVFGVIGLITLIIWAGHNATTVRDGSK